jgi:hypothetical protein
MKKYLLEVDQYKAFLAGQDQATTKRVKAMAQYIHDWERKWERLAGDGILQGKLSQICFAGGCHY